MGGREYGACSALLGPGSHSPARTGRSPLPPAVWYLGGERAAGSTGGWMRVSREAQASSGAAAEGKP